jgi:starch synthase (maltosyl-transferring)
MGPGIRRGMQETRGDDVRRARSSVSETADIVPSDAAPSDRWPPRVVIERVEPSVDAGRFAAKAALGDLVRVEADVFADGHDIVAAVVRYRPVDGDAWTEVAMEPLGQDRFRAEFTLNALGDHEFTVHGWVDRFASWRHGAARKVAAGVARPVDAQVGAILVREAARHAGDAHDALAHWSGELERGDLSRIDDDELALLVSHHAPREPLAGTASYRITVARPRARFSAWYELFPRSWGPGDGAHGTLADCRERLPYVAAMGFDVLYLPPIHPIGTTHRKGPNNASVAGPRDVGSPWAIGSTAGGHTAIHPDLGTFDDFRALVSAAADLGLEIALDIAFQCSPDHPWVHDHPEWFHHLPDGSIQPAENPPKRYEDVYPIDFETEHWWELWQELEGVVRFWIGHGVKIFRVDNPHTKPFAFWEWMIERVRGEHPDVIFLAEAFTRPSLMYRLAKLGFDQSYTYFAWRQGADELREYLTELTTTDVAKFFRPNAWPNTPDILTEQLQWGGESIFVSRLVLAATLFASYGIYGPAFELRENAARDGVEEYVDNEKYQIRAWDLDSPVNLAPLIGIVNRVRRSHAALQTNDTLHFHGTDNPALLCYSKTAPDAGVVEAGADDAAVLVVVNVDPYHRQSGYVELDLDVLGLDPAEPFLVSDLLAGGHFRWQGARNYVELDPHVTPAHVFAVRCRVRTEHDFDYF